MERDVAAGGELGLLDGQTRHQRCLRLRAIAEITFRFMQCRGFLSPRMRGGALLLGPRWCSLAGCRTPPRPPFGSAPRSYLVPLDSLKPPAKRLRSPSGS